MIILRNLKKSLVKVCWCTFKVPLFKVLLFEVPLFEVPSQEYGTYITISGGKLDLKEVEQPSELVLSNTSTKQLTLRKGGCEEGVRRV